MSQIQEILQKAKEEGASDLHITVGIPPKMRVNGDLIDMNYPKLLPPDTEAVLEEVMSAKQVLKYKTGTMQDLDAVCLLIKDAIAEMERNGIYQWDEVYPARYDLDKYV